MKKEPGRNRSGQICIINYGNATAKWHSHQSAHQSIDFLGLWEWMHPHTDVWLALVGLNASGGDNFWGKKHFLQAEILDLRCPHPSPGQNSVQYWVKSAVDKSDQSRWKCDSLLLGICYTDKNSTMISGDYVPVVQDDKNYVGHPTDDESE